MLAKLVFKLRSAAAPPPPPPQSAAQKQTKKTGGGARKRVTKLEKKKEQQRKKRMAIAFDVFIRRKGRDVATATGTQREREEEEDGEEDEDEDEDETSRPRDEVVWRSHDRVLQMTADGTVFHLSDLQKKTPVLNAALEVINRSIQRDCSIRNMSSRVFQDFRTYAYSQHESRFVLPLREMLQGPRAPRQLLVIQAMKGMGKSKCIRGGISSVGGEGELGCCPPRPTVLNLTFRRVLARGVSKELGPEAQSYLDFPPEEVFDAGKTRVLTILVNSLHRTKGAWDVLIIDEVVSVLEMLGSRLIDPATQFRIVNRLIELILGSRLVIVADAHNNAETLVAVRELALGAAPEQDWDVRVHDFVFRNRADHRYFSTRTLADWKQILFSKLASHQRIVVPSMTRRFALDLAAEIRRRFPRLRVLCYVANPEEEIDMEAHMADVNSVWADADVLIYSPIITAGCSFEVEDYYDCCMMYAITGCSTVGAAVQMTARVRSLRQNETVVYVDRVDDCFGGVISAPEEIVIREAWAASVEACRRSRNAGERAVGIIDMICSMSSKTDNVRKLRFESEFWICVAWGGGILRSFDVMAASPEARAVVVSHIGTILDAAEICCVRPRIYAPVASTPSSSSRGEGASLHPPKNAGERRRRFRRGQVEGGRPEVDACGSGQLIRRLAEEADETIEEAPRILRLLGKPGGGAEARGGGGGGGRWQKQATKFLALQEDRRLELAGTSSSSKGSKGGKRPRTAAGKRKEAAGEGEEDGEEEEEEEGLPGEEERIATILSLQNIESGSFFDEATGESTPCPSSLRLGNVFRTVDDWSPLLGDMLCRDPAVNFHHLEHLGILSRPVFDAISWSRRPLQGAASLLLLPRWVSQENAHVWQLASIRVLQKMLWERLETGRAVPGVQPRAPPRCFSRCGIISYTNASRNPRGGTPEEIAQHDCVPSGIFEKVPFPREDLVKMWAKYLAVTGEVEAERRENGREACAYAWRASAADLDSRSMETPSKEQFDAMAAYCRKVLEEHLLPLLRDVTSSPGSSEAGEVDEKTWKLLLDPHTGQAASKPRHHHVHLALVSSDREMRAINLNMFSSEGQAPQIVHAWSIPHLLVSAAAVARTYGYVVSECIHALPHAGTVMRLSTPDLPSMRIQQEFILRKFITTPPIRAIFVLATSSSSSSPSSARQAWDIWWPEGGLKLRGASPKKLCRILRANTERGLLSAANVVTWGESNRIEACLRRFWDDCKAVKATTDRIQDLRLHAAFHAPFSNCGDGFDEQQQQLSLDAARSLDIVESNRAIRMVHHAAGSRPFPETKAQGPQPMPADVPASCAKLAQVYFGCMRAKNMAFIGGRGGEITHIIPTNPFLRVGDVRCFDTS